MKRNFLLFIITAALCCGGITDGFAQITLANNSKSTFTIVIPAGAPSSVRNAADELQKCLELATSVKLPLQKDTAQVSTSILSLGNTQQAKAAGLNSEKMVDESFRIITKDGNLFILGPDTPEKGWTKNNGVSNGTANGVYTFLEDYLNVRWLMPGDIGRDVPIKSTFTLEKMDRTYDPPMFSLRRVSHLWDYSNRDQQRSIDDWTEHLRLGGATSIYYEHNWWQTINGDRNGAHDSPAVKALYEAHPEWFAMDASGKRPFPQSKYAKLETTNQELVRWYAERAIAALKASERPTTYSLSPTDGGGRWSKSPESKALYDPNPSTIFDPEVVAGDPSMSSLVLKWYHDISNIVAKEYPEGRLAGYIYSSYVYPPTKIAAKLPDNFTPMICGIGTYGYGLYRPENQERWKYVMDSWADIVTGNWYYYDLPNQLLRQYEPEVGADNFPGSTGIITPAAPDILNVIYPQLVKSHIKGNMMYGVPSWSNGALGNYLLAKMTWDPTQNVHELQKEWLHRAYGSQAGAVMEEFYRQLNGWFRQYYQQNSGLSYKLTHDMLRDIYAAHYPEMEKLFLQAKAEPMTEKQQQRLQLIEYNMIVLQWRLRNAGLFPADFASSLQRENEQVIALLTRPNDDFALFPGAVESNVVNWNRAKPFSWKVQFSKDGTATMDKSTFKGLGDSSFLLYAAQEGDIRITPETVTQGPYFASYEIRNQAGEMVNSGILNTGTPIIIPAKTGDFFVLNIPPRKPVNYKLAVQNATIADGSFDGQTLTLSGAPAAVYIYSPLRDAPLGVMENADSVIIKKPFSGMAGKATLLRSGLYEDVKVVDSYDENWRFSPDPDNDGLQRGVEKPDFDDSSWEMIGTLNWWQFQGFPDYLGAAWYRMTFHVDEIPKGRTAYLYFGGIDGDAVIYLNGQMQRERKLGENYEGWDKPFGTYVTNRLKPGENTLAIKVTSKPVGSSGIYKGVSLLTATKIKK